MAQTLLQTAQNVASSIGIQVPSTLVGSSDDTDRRILQAIREAGRALARRDWVRLTYSHTFSTASGITQYTLPTSPAFDHMVPGSAWDRTMYRYAEGPITSVMYQRAQADGLSATLWARPWTLRADGNRLKVFELQDDPLGTYTVAFDYVTAEWLWDGASLYSDTISADTQQPVFQDELIEAATRWRVLRAMGMDYTEPKAEADALEARLFAQERAGVVDLAPQSFGLSFDNAPEYGYG